MEISAAVKSVKEEKQTSNGSKRFTVLLEDDDRVFSVFDTELEPGQKIKAEVEERKYRNRTYNNLQQVEIVSRESEKSETNNGHPKNGNHTREMMMLISYGKDLTCESIKRTEKNLTPEEVIELWGTFVQSGIDLLEKHTDDIPF